MGGSTVTVDHLSSGLTLLRIDRPGWPVMTADVWVRAGSADEAPAQAGISHFLEHMMFKGTERRGPGELDRIVEGVGGLWNAGTSKDFTHYHLTVPADHWALALDALGDAVLRSVIDAAEVERERSVILEEWRRSEDSPGHLLWMRSYDTAFASGSLRWPVIGTQETISSITRDQLAAYHRGQCRPENMALVMAGPVGGEVVLAEAERQFTWVSPAEPITPPSLEQQWNAGAVQTMTREVSEIYMAIAWPAPDAHDPKAMVAMDVVQFLLGQGRASRLHRRLYEEKRLVTTITATYPAHRQGGVFMVLATCAPGREEEVREAVVEEVTALSTQRAMAAEAARARRLLINQHIFGRETTSGHTSSVGFHHTLTGQPDFDDRYTDLVAKVTTPAISKAAREWLTEEAAATVAIGPHGHQFPWRGDGKGASA